ncbi:MAG TPA: hypothetical protein VGL94_02590 [Ktedonobacteraceae bacterium]
MEPRITQATQDVSKLLPLEGSIDAIELTDEDLEKVTGTWGHFGGRGGFGFGFRHFHRFPFRHFGHFGGSAISISSVAIAG